MLFVAFFGFVYVYVSLAFYFYGIPRGHQPGREETFVGEPSASQTLRGSEQSWPGFEDCHTEGLLFHCSPSQVKGQISL